MTDSRDRARTEIFSIPVHWSRLLWGEGTEEKEERMDTATVGPVRGRDLRRVVVAADTGKGR